MLTTLQALDHFRNEVASLGQPAEVERLPFGGYVALVSFPGALVRLTWNAKSNYLALEINQGPAHAPFASWLELFGAMCQETVVPEPRDPETSFSESLAYALELAHPSPWLTASCVVNRTAQ